MPPRLLMRTPKVRLLLIPRRGPTPLPREGSRKLCFNSFLQFAQTESRGIRCFFLQMQHLRSRFRMPFCEEFPSLPVAARRTAASWVRSVFVVDAARFGPVGMELSSAGASLGRRADNRPVRPSVSVLPMCLAEAGRFVSTVAVARTFRTRELGLEVLRWDGSDSDAEPPVERACSPRFLERIFINVLRPDGSVISVRH